MTFYRAKAYKTLGLPNRPKVHVDILYGPWKDREPPAQILAKAMKMWYPDLTPVVQTATRS